jgi:hypothetical protein
MFPAYSDLVTNLCVCSDLVNIIKRILKFIRSVSVYIPI